MVASPGSGTARAELGERFGLGLGLAWNSACAAREKKNILAHE